jgi:hypothetical protein
LLRHGFNDDFEEEKKQYNDLMPFAKMITVPKNLKVFCFPVAIGVACECMHSLSLSVHCAENFYIFFEQSSFLQTAIMMTKNIVKKITIIKYL